MATKASSPVQALVPILLGMSPDEGQTIVDLLQGIVDHRRELWAQMAKAAKRVEAGPASVSPALRQPPVLIGAPAVTVNAQRPVAVPTPAPTRRRGPGRPRVSTPAASAVTPTGKKRGRKPKAEAHKPTGAMPPLGTAPTSHDTDVPLPMGMPIAGEDFPAELPVQMPASDLPGRPVVE